MKENNYPIYDIPETILEELGLLYPATISCETAYSDDPSQGNPDFERMLNGEQCWPKPASETIIRKKELILINQPLMDMPNFFCEKDRIAVQALYRSLLKIGFELYPIKEVDKSGYPTQLIKISEEILSSKDKDEKITHGSIHYTKITSFLAKKGKIADKVKVLGILNIGHILERLRKTGILVDQRWDFTQYVSPGSFEFKIKLSSLYKLKSADYEIVLDSFDERIPFHLHIDISESEKDNYYLKKLLDRNLLITGFDTSLSHFFFIANYCPKALAVLDSLSLYGNHACEIENINLLKSTLYSLLKNNQFPTKLKSLSLSYLDYESCLIFIRNCNSLNTLRTMYLSLENENYADNIELQKIRNLKTFECPFFYDFLKINEKYPLENLNELIDETADINFNDPLLPLKLKSLKRFAFDWDRSILTLCEKNPFWLKTLETIMIEVGNDGVNFKELTFFINALKNIKSFSLILFVSSKKNKGTLSQVLENFDPQILAQLTCLRLEKTDENLNDRINSKATFNILENAKNLEELFLGFSCLSIDQNLRKIFLTELSSKLKKLTLTRSQISARTIISLIKRCPDLRILTLNECQIDDLYVLETPEASAIISQLHAFNLIDSVAPEQMQTLTLLMNYYPMIKGSQRKFLSSINDKEDEEKTQEEAVSDVTFSLDSNTSSGALEQTVKLYFKPKFQDASGTPFPAPRQYILDYKDAIYLKNGEVLLSRSALPFSPTWSQLIAKTNTPDWLADLYENEFKAHPSIFYGKVPLILSSSPQDWILLPALTLDNELLELNGRLVVEADHEVELRYDQYDGNRRHYSVKLPDGQRTKQVTLHYLIKAEGLLAFPKRVIAPNALSIVRNCLSNFIINEAKYGFTSEKAFNWWNQLNPKQKLNALIVFCQNFVDRPLPSKSPPNSIALLNAIMNNYSGACRHSATSFWVQKKYLIDGYNKINTLLLLNDCHVFDAILKDRWQLIDLGGQPSKLSYQDIFNLQEETTTIEANSQSQVLIPLVTYEEQTKQVKFYEELYRDIQRLTPATQCNILLGFESEAELEFFHGLFIEYLSTTSHTHFYIDSLANVSRYTQQYLEEQTPSEANISLLNHSAKKRKIDPEILYPSLSKFPTANSEQNTGYRKVDSHVVQWLKQAKAGDVLIINLCDYSSSDVGTFNTLGDEKRSFIDIILPEGLVVLGLLTTKKIAERAGEQRDFFRRFYIHLQAPTHNFLWENTLTAHSRSVDLNNNLLHLYEIDLYENKKNWRHRLIVTPRFKGRQIKPEKGALIQALERNYPGLVIYNPPQSSEFRAFYCELLTVGFFFNGEKTRRQLPRDFVLMTAKKTYIFNTDYETHYLDHSSEQDWNYVLNRHTRSLFFFDYLSSEEGFFRQPGWFQTHPRRWLWEELRVLVTDQFSMNEWAEWLDKAAYYFLRPVLIFASPELIPPCLRMPRQMLPAQRGYSDNWKVALEKRTALTIIYTNDIDLTTARILSPLFRDDIEAIMPDFIYHLKSQGSSGVLYHYVNGLFAYQFEYGYLAQALLTGKRVLVKGTPLLDMRQKLETLLHKKPYLWLNGERKEVTGHLILVCDRPIFQFAANYVEKLWVEDAQKLKEIEATLESEYISKISDEKFKSYILVLKKLYQTVQPSYSLAWGYLQFRIALENMIANPEKNPFRPFLLLFEEDKNQLKKIAEYYRELCKHHLSDWNDHIFQEHRSQRKKQIEKNWAYATFQKIHRCSQRSPAIFIIGDSGVGKSTFVLEELKAFYLQQNQYIKIYVGIESYKVWKEDNEEDWIFLFLDEVNLKKPDFCDIFEELFENPQLSAKHRLICAGNFSSYTNRQIPQLFQRHGGVLVFNHPTKNFLILGVMMPTLRYFLTPEELTNQECRELAEFYFAMYGFINNYQSVSKLNQRNLKMMCLQFAWLWKQRREYDWRTIAIIASGYELETLPSEVKEACKLFIQNSFSQFYEDNRPSIKEEVENFLKQHLQPNKSSGHFLLTESRYLAFRLLLNHLNIRKMRMEKYKEGDKTFGSAGLLIEGESETGKNELLNWTFSWLETLYPGLNLHVDMLTVSMIHLDALESKLQHNFDNGVITVIHEFNSLPSSFMESVLNPLMSGVSLNGKRPKKEGFLVIGTQNPITYGNRQLHSPAMENRFQKIVLSEYLKKELILILENFGLSQKKAEAFADDYIKEKEHAQKQHTRSPSLGQWLNKARVALTSPPSVPPGYEWKPCREWNEESFTHMRIGP